MAANPLPVVFFSVVVKRAAVAARYPGGTEEFDRVYQPARSNGELAAVACMSMMDAGLVFDRLHSAGLVPGEDFGLVEMHQGVLVPCHGIRAIPLEREPFLVEWFAELDESYRYQPEDGEFEWQSAEPKPPAAPAQLSEQPRPPKEPGEKRPPTRVIFGSGPVHWLYHDDEDEDDE